MEDQAGLKLQEDMKLQAGFDEEETLSDSPCMERDASKQQSVEEDAPASDQMPISRAPRKRTAKKVAYDNDLPNKGRKRKRGIIISKAHTLALKNAKELQTTLSSEHPNFIKQLQLSHVSRFYKMGIPAEFCRSHLPTNSVEVTLEDESGESYTMKFLTSTEGTFVGGWKRFAEEHNLLQGDVVVLHLIKDCYFRVYIVKANDPSAVEIAGFTPNVPSNEGKKKRKRKAADIKSPRIATLLNTVPETGGRQSPPPSSSDLGPASSQSDRNDLQSSDVEVSKLSDRTADFEKFKIVVNGVTLDPDIPTRTRFMYYMICCSRETYLHEHMLKNVELSLAAEMIKGTVKAADDLRACKLSTSKDEFAMWEKSFDGFESFGMNIGFLRDRLRRLVTMGSELRWKEEVKKYVDAKIRRGRIQEEIRSYERKLLELKQAEEEVEDEMKTMKENILKHKDAFKQEATAPW